MRTGNVGTGPCAGARRKLGVQVSKLRCRIARACQSRQTHGFSTAVAVACYVRRPLRNDSLVGGQGECMDADAKVSRRIMSGLAATKARGVVQRSMPARVRMVCSLVALLGAAAHSHVAGAAQLQGFVWICGEDGAVAEAQRIGGNLRLRLGWFQEICQLRHVGRVCLAHLQTQPKFAEADLGVSHQPVQVGRSTGMGSVIWNSFPSSSEASASPCTQTLRLEVALHTTTTDSALIQGYRI